MTPHRANRSFYAPGVIRAVSGANNIQCEKCGVPRDMGLYDIIKYEDGTTRWKLECLHARRYSPGNTTRTRLTRGDEIVRRAAA